LRSKIVYYNFIEKNKSKILEVIRVPNLTKKKTGKNSFYLIKKFISSPICHKLYILILVNLYLLINFFIRSDIESLVKKNGIKFNKFKSIPDSIYFNKKYKKIKFVVLCSTSHILQKNNFSNKFKILNIHEGDLPRYAGSATYYYAVLNNEKFYRSTLMLPNLTIDAGNIVKKSNKYLIKNKSVFQVLLLGLYASSKLLTSNFPKKIVGKNHKSKNKKFFSFSFPNDDLVTKLKKNKKVIFKFSDYFFLIKIIFLKNKKNIYNEIRLKLNL
jgi:hypothetical protein